MGVDLGPASNAFLKGIAGLDCRTAVISGIGNKHHHPPRQLPRLDCEAWYWHRSRFMYIAWRLYLIMALEKEQATVHQSQRAIQATPSPTHNNYYQETTSPALHSSGGIVIKPATEEGGRERRGERVRGDAPEKAVGHCAGCVSGLSAPLSLPPSSELPSNSCMTAAGAGLAWA